jgi:hypothetical protein
LFLTRDSFVRYNHLRHDAMELPDPQRRIYDVLSGHMRPFLDRRKIPLNSFSAE